MKKTVVSCLLLLVAGGKVAAAAPAWCAADGVDKHEMMYSNVKDVLDADPSNALPAIVASLCWPDEEAKDRIKEIEKARASWSKKLDLQDTDWADVAQYASTTKSMRWGHLPLDFENKLAWSTLSPTEQYAGIENGFPNNGNGNSISEYTYLTDALGTRLTATGRLAYVQQACFNKDAIAEWAMCDGDIALLDPRKIADEIRKDTKASGLSRMKLRLIIYGLDKRLAEHAKDVEKAKAKEAAYAKMFEIAAATRKEWDTISKTETQLLDLALLMDDARQTASRKAMEGCSEKTWAAWKAVVEKLPAKGFEGFSTDITDSWMAPAAAVITTTVPGYLASIALYTCHKAAVDKDPVISTIGSTIVYVPGLRGPRTATLWALRNANLQLDDTSAKISFPDFRYDQKYGGGHEARGYFATVAKIKVDGDKAVVSFTPKLEKQEQCASARRTNRITQIRPDGSLIYESICTSYKSVTVDKSPDAQTVDVRYTAGVKPGMNVNISTGAIFAAWTKGKKSPAVVAGVTLK
jgi:hypothetical protein